MTMVAQSDWVIDMGPGAGDEGGIVIAAGPPTAIVSVKDSRTAPYLNRALEGAIPPLNPELTFRSG